MLDVKNLDEYLVRYGQLLGEAANRTLDPIHVPGRDPLPDFSRYTRQPYPAQANVIAASVKTLCAERSLEGCEEMGTGKTIMAILTADLHARHYGRRKFRAEGRPRHYRALVMCPGHLVDKWDREIRETLPDATVTQVRRSSVLNRLWRTRGARDTAAPDWYVIGRDRAKLAADWKPAAVQWTQARPGKRAGLYCPSCHQQIVDKEGNPLGWEYLQAAQRKCKATVVRWLRRKDVEGKWVWYEKVELCGGLLYSYYGPQLGGLDRFEPARYIHKRMRGYFDYFILDEAHEEKSATSNQANAAGALMAAAKWVLPLTGTQIGGYAEHIRPLLFRKAPTTLVAEGLTWTNGLEFCRRYGRIERIKTEKSSGDGDRTARQGRGGGSQREREIPRPGIMPTLFGRHLIGKSVYLALDEMSDQLPAYREIVCPVDLSPEQAGLYEKMDQTLRQVNSELVAKGFKGFLGAMLQTLLAWPDYPFAWETVGYWQGPAKAKTFTPVLKPPELSELKTYPKEDKLLEIVKAEKAAGRQCWVFVQYTDRHNVQSRLVDLFNDHRIRATALKSSVAVEKREAWIAENGPKYDVIVSFPKLVETGLDLFDKGGGHNFPSIIFYETGYNPFQLRQASRRAWRIGQREECRVYFLFYAGTMQENAMTLMGRKLAAAHALEGKFSTEGLVAMGGDDVGVEMALAKSIDSVIKGDGARAWGKIAEVITAPIRAKAATDADIDRELAALGDLDDLFEDDDFEDDFNDLVELDKLLDELEEGDES